MEVSERKIYHVNPMWCQTLLISQGSIVSLTSLQSWTQEFYNFPYINIQI